MKNIVGKNIFFSAVLFFCTNADAASATMQLADAQGKHVDQIVVGVPFQVRVVVKGQNTGSNYPRIENWDDLTWKRSGIQMHSINGASTTVYMYTVVASVAKKYTVGPAVILSHGSDIVADALQFQAVSASTHTAGQLASSAKQTDQPFMECHIDKDTVFLGEIATCTLRFYCPSHMGQVILKQIKGPHINGMQLVQKGGQKEGVELIKQRPFKYIEWDFDMQFLTEGVTLIPPFYGEYTVEDEDENMLLGGFSIFFQHNKVRQAQSNSLSVLVNSVPTYKGQPVVAVGSFTDFSASVSQSAMAVSDAVLFSLQLTGEGNFSMIHHPVLTGMPDGIKVYNSQSKIDMFNKNNQAEKTKSFDYIVQASNAGIVTLPSQKLVFFDVTDKKHKVLKTAPVHIQVKQADSVAPVVHAPDEKSTSAKNSTEHTIEPVSCMDSFKESGYASWAYPFSYNWVLFLSLTPLLCLILYYISMMLLLFFYTLIRYRCAYFNARKRLQKLELANKSTHILEVFKQYVQHRRPLHLYHDTDSFKATVALIVRDHSLIADWHHFYAQIVKAAYGSSAECHHDDALWQQAYYWLRLLKKKGL